MLLTKSDLHLTTLDKIVHDISCTLVNTCPSGSVVILTLSAPIPQNCQTHSNNLSTVSLFDHFVELALKGLRNASFSEIWLTY